MKLSNQSSISDYLNRTFSCDCGREHIVPIKYIHIEENATLSLPEFVKDNHFHKSFFLFDLTTYSIAGEKLQQIFHQALMPFTCYIINDMEPVPDERTLGEILIHFDTSCDHIIAVGSGTINDLSRFLSYKLKLPYIIYATAPSMDGFASNVAPLIVNHMKTTYEAHTPTAVIADTNILKTAPSEMIAAGIGDILGKYTCLCEWKISHLITGEYHCSSIEGLVRESIETVEHSINDASEKKTQAVKSIMEGLVLSGIAMSFAGNSRPASGSEHHLSHYWEMMYLFQGKKPVLHGTKVGIATVAVLKAFELFLQQKPDFKKARENANHFSKTDWDAQMLSTYFDAAPSVIRLENEIGKNSPKNVQSRLQKLEENWTNLEEIANGLPSADHVRSLLISLSAPASPIAVGITKEIFMNSFLVAKELRNRYGLLQILFDLGLSRDIAQQVWNYFSAE
jgi:Glycerol dehydrogenase and related enzymes